MDAKAAKKPLLLSPAPTNDEKRLEQHPIRQFFSSLLGLLYPELPILSS
jgi:hypothetical protein